ncbi:MAG: quaternary ammonium compound efflux SMR transporter SugE [Desulfitobacterium hafniense]|nr:quaternary ammonium compound efflux SMR transporter SugE [Desulfitobacterium hafniense]
MAWFYLLIAGVFEIVWATGLKLTSGFTKLIPSIVTVMAMMISFYFLALATKTLPIGTSYAVWTGIGVIGTVILGIVLFNESRELPRLFFLSLIVIGIIGLKFSSSN